MFFINHSDIEEGRGAIVEIDGPLNSESSPDFEDYIKKLIENGTVFLLIDFKKLSFISSEGIGAAIMLNKRAAAGNGTAVFCNLNSEVTGLFRILGFNRIFTIAENISEALDILEERMGYRKPERREKLKTDDDTMSPEERELPLPEPELEDFDEPAVFNDDFEFIESKAIEPFVIECLKCGSPVRIKERGDHICPFCRAEFSVSGRGKALFKIDEPG